MQPEKHKNVVHVSEHVMEVRYRPSGSFLGVAGKIADYFFDKEVFPHWQIQSNGNRVDFRDAPNEVKKFGAFVTFRNAGYVVFNPDTKNLFVDKALSFWKHALANQDFTIPKITRFGCRGKVFIQTDAEFLAIRQKFAAFTITSEARQLAGGDLQDFSVSLEVKDSDFTARVQMGPVKKDEAQKYFSFESDAFGHSGVFLDLDLYTHEVANQKEVGELLKKANDRLWTKVDSLYAALAL